MRIVSGRFRRYNLLAPKGLNTRPMPDRVREAVCETLGSHWGTVGKLPPVGVLDLFAGSGAVGLEALSRGAAGCCFVERAGVALKALRTNVSSVLADRQAEMAQVLQADAFRPGSWMHLVARVPVDLVMVDPPYAASRDASATGSVGRLLQGLADGALLADEAVVVLRHEARVEYDRCPCGGFETMNVRRYGGMKVTYLARGTSQ